MTGLPSDTEIAALCNGIYAYPGYAPVAWDYLSLAAPGAFKPSFGIQQVGDISVLVFRGSVSLADWLRDFDSLTDPLETLLEALGFQLAAVPVPHAYLGPVHPGFLIGLETAIDEALPHLGENIVVAGHSLGAGEATLATGILVHRGRAPKRRVVFGEPRSGFKPLAKLIADVPSASYRNGDRIVKDLVTEVPLAIDAEAYVHCCPLVDVCAKPEGTMFERWRVLAWHGMPLYLQALERLAGMAADLPETMMMPLLRP